MLNSSIALLFANDALETEPARLENLTKESIENIINFPKNIDNSKAKKDLGLTISPLDKTVKDSIYG